MRTANAVLGAKHDMKLSEKLDGWINYLESIDAPDKLPSIARDYPEAWADLQKQRAVLKWLWRLSGFVIPLPIAASIFKMQPTAFHMAYNLWFFSFIVIMVVIKVSHRFWCPQCGKAFLDAYARNAHYVLNNPKSKCMHCGLLIGEPKPTA
jgi:predicted RNA-binding Zn-ribbon protein involved in translation (DUF1610 family)